jgi:hypothetical protein
MDKHPGGREMLLLAAGRECTDLFSCYHPFTDRPRKFMKSYEIGVLEGPSEFPVYAPDNGFYATLKKRVAAYFEKTGLDPKSPWGGVVRMIPVFAAAGAERRLHHAHSIDHVSSPCSALLRRYVRTSVADGAFFSQTRCGGRVRRDAGAPSAAHHARCK